MPSLPSKVWRLESWRRKRVWRGRRDMSAVELRRGGWGEAWERAGRARWRRVRRVEGRRSMVVVVVVVAR